ncbi:diadenosine 5'5'''-P1,P4-tetraphosphate pyrophosphohydrolase [Clostridia bacterium]|nr:diadenosine 5'5'''-P1,P4-tetraphosphate pyrophosphohydrolase [Clostridia bacterium]
MERMKKDEKSCGAIILRRTANGSKEVLLIKHYFSENWGFPKGHMKENEREEETAIREVLEETRISIDITHDFRAEVFYRCGFETKKKVVFFLATNASKPVSEGVDHRVERVAWVNVKRACDKLNFQNDRDILFDAIEYLKKCKELF